MDVSKNRRDFTPKMDGENNGKPNPMNKWDDLEGKKPYFWDDTHIMS